jgi:hypothetical protein
LHRWIQEEFEDPKDVIRIVYRRRTDNTMAKRKSTKGQTTIYKTVTVGAGIAYPSGAPEFTPGF